MYCGTSMFAWIIDYTVKLPAISDAMMSIRRHYNVLGICIYKYLPKLKRIWSMVVLCYNRFPPNRKFHRHDVLCVIWPHLLPKAHVHDDIIKWKHFPRYWSFVRGIHRSPVNSPHKGQWRGALMFTLICVRINGWANTRGAGDLRRHRPHCDVIVM